MTTRHEKILKAIQNTSQKKEKIITYKLYEPEQKWLLKLGFTVTILKNYPETNQSLCSISWKNAKKDTEAYQYLYIANNIA